MTANGRRMTGASPPELDGGRTTVLCLELGDAEPQLGPVRAAFYPTSVARGIPLHLTLLHPFLPRAACDTAVADRIRRVCAARPALVFSLARVRLLSEGHVVVLAEPVDGIRALMDALLREFPAASILRGDAPYTAVGRARDRDDDQILLEQIRDRVEPDLPIRCAIESVALFEEAAPGCWQARDRFPLGTETGSRPEPAGLRL
jgi:hypothetical protein